MTEAQKDTERAKAAVKAIIDGRDMLKHRGMIMVTIEHTIALALLMVFRDPALSAGMLNEGLVPGIEERLALYASKLKESGL